MKKITSLFAIVMLFAVAAFAQKAPMVQLNAQTLNDHSKIAAMAKDRTTATTTKAHKAPAKANVVTQLVTLPDGATAEEWSATGNFIVNQSNRISQMSFAVAIVGNDFYIKGLAYYFQDGWVKGTLSGNTVTFPITLIGSDSYGDEYLAGGVVEDGSVTALSDFTFTYNASENTLTLNGYIFENDGYEEPSFWGYGYNIVLTKGAAEKPDPVTPPAGLQTEEWTFNYVPYQETTTESFPVQVGFDGDDVYIQGICTPVTSGMASAWIKGTRNGNTITVATDQYFGNYINQYDFYFVCYQGGVNDVNFTINTEENQITAPSDAIFLISSQPSSLSGYVIFTEVVITKAVEVAATPADPEVDDFVENQYGHYFTFSIPTTGTNGEDLLSSKLYYQIYKDVEGVVTPFTLSADLYEELDEDMSVIPYSFTDSYDIFPGTTTQVYIYSADLDDWNKIGVKSIYEGAGETHESNIVWLDIKPYTPTAIALNVTDEDEVALLPGETFQLEVVSVVPEGADAEVVWSSSDEHIATVSEDGLVTGMQFDGKAIRDGANGISRVPNDNDNYDYFPVVITATVASDDATAAPVSASVQMWVKSSTRTAVTDVKVSNVESVKYVNAQGQVSNTPFDGVNIEVTRLSDGTTKTAKVIK